MTTTSVMSWSTTPGSNTDVAGNGIAGSSNISLGNDVFQNIMAQIATGMIQRGSDIATATTVDFTAATTPSLLHDLTGTTTVTAVTMTAGWWRLARAQGAFQLTASSTLVVNGSTSTNYTTKAGDLLVFFGYSSSTVRVWAFSGGTASSATTGAAGIVQLATLAQTLAQSPAGLVPTIENLYFPTGHLFGCTISNNGGTPASKIDVAAGTCRDSTDSYDFLLTSAITAKDLTSAWAVGSSAGLLDTGSVGNNTYHIYLIKRTDTGFVDVIASLSASAPTLPTNYTLYRRIGSIVRSGGSILAFIQNGDNFQWKSPIVDVDATNPGTSAVTRTLTVPIGIKVEAIITGLWGGFSSSSMIYISDLAVTDNSVQATGTSTLSGMADTESASPSTGFWGGAVKRVFTNTSGQVRSRASASGASDHLGIITQGWVDSRGRQF